MSVRLAPVPERTAPAVDEIEYPESDGKPMGETGFHVLALLHLLSALRNFFLGRTDLYIIGNMFLYYEEGNPKANKVPDVMVIKGVDSHERRIFKTWEEKAVPSVIFEITSKSTRAEDMVGKSALYASLGVAEYFLFDPIQEYLEEQLLGFRLHDNEYVPIEAHKNGTLFSRELGVLLRPEGRILRVMDPRTGRRIPGLDETYVFAQEETERARREAERARREAERARREAERADAAEAEVARLRAELERLHRSDGA